MDSIWVTSIVLCSLGLIVGVGVVFPLLWSQVGHHELGAAAAMDPRLMGLNLPVLGIFRGTGVPMGVSGWYPKVPPLWLQGGEYFGHPDPFLPIPNGFSPPTSSHQHTCGALGCITEVQVSLPLPLLTFSPTSLSFFFLHPPVF